MPLDKRAKCEKDAQIMIKLLQRELELLAKGKKVAAKTTAPKDEDEEEKPYLNPSVTFTSTKDEGRFALANTKIQVADAILVERPHCAVLLENYSKTHCDTCLKRVRTLIPCEHCPNVIFCSEKCLDASKSGYHRFECGILSAIWSSYVSVTCHMALRVMAQRSCEYFSTIREDLKHTIEPNEWNK
jgi:SET and MYND domain-containing protein 4